MTMHEEYEDLAALDAVGALESEEKSRLRAHLRECSDCLTARREFQQAASILALGVDPVTPPDALRTKILDSVGESEESIEFVAQHRVASTRRWLAAAAVFFFALFLISEFRIRNEREKLVALGSSNRQLQSENAMLRRSRDLVSAQVAALAAPGTSTISLTGQEVAPSASARVFLDAPSRRAFVFFYDLPKNSETTSYQLWVIPKDATTPMSAGVFDVDPKGAASLVVENLPLATEIKALAVTLEPKGGLKAPSGAMYLVGNS